MAGNRVSASVRTLSFMTALTVGLTETAWSLYDRRVNALRRGGLRPGPAAGALPLDEPVLGHDRGGFGQVHDLAPLDRGDRREHEPVAAAPARLRLVGHHTGRIGDQPQRRPVVTCVHLRAHPASSNALSDVSRKGPVHAARGYADLSMGTDGNRDSTESEASGGWGADEAAAPPRHRCELCGGGRGATHARAGGVGSDQSSADDGGLPAGPHVDGRLRSGQPLRDL